ncbi:hypothetical protein SSABA_v1c02510 [Spiroplasma sabaudiense Ar-1343]|uniref:Transmembrane protein n=1 Tax=Spiroplasma sabaudiense Ar-1343 TaxID=1276257 RepID=W6A946_9MOLU|nr:hypothetical protein [Spiroplasma sabaudiense]AHI53663.1 hypothetical protein SSABA_v1c02510 [Spiroplasma sabaudiense Ar-1343]
MNQQLSRMERNRELHQKVNRDIIIEKESQLERSNISAIFKTLDGIDKNYFRAKVKEFDEKNTIEKPYLDKDKSKLLVKEELKYDLRRFINELSYGEQVAKKAKEKKNPILERIDDSNSVNLTSQKFIDYYHKIARNEQTFQDQVIDLRKRTDGNQNFTSDINFATVTKVRNADNRTTSEMLKEVSDKNERSYNLIMKETKMFKYRFKWMIYFLPILIILMLLAIIIPIFI